MNALFPVKLMSILEKLETNEKWQSQIHYAEQHTGCDYPKDGRTRVALMAPQLTYVIRSMIDTSEYFRVRLAYSPDNFWISKNTLLEIYDINGKLTKVIAHPEWSTTLSLAMETEMLEILLNINPW